MFKFARKTISWHNSVVFIIIAIISWERDDQWLPSSYFLGLMIEPFFQPVENPGLNYFWFFRGCPNSLALTFVNDCNRHFMNHTEKKSEYPVEFSRPNSGTFWVRSAKDHLGSTINRIPFLKLLICIGKSLKWLCLHIWFLYDFLLRLVHLKGEIDRKRRAVAAYAIVTTTIKEENKYKQQKMYGVGSGVYKKREWTKTEMRELDNKMLFNFSINRSLLAI